MHLGLYMCHGIYYFILQLTFLFFFVLFENPSGNSNTKTHLKKTPKKAQKILACRGKEEYILNRDFQKCSVPYHKLILCRQCEKHCVTIRNRSKRKNSHTDSWVRSRIRESDVSFVFYGCRRGDSSPVLMKLQMRVVKVNHLLYRLAFHRF